MGAVCWQCIEDEYLKTIVRNQGKAAKCDVCERRRKAFTAEDFAEALDPIMREHFTQGESVKRFGDDDHDWWEQEGDVLDQRIQEVVGQYLGFEEEIVDLLEEMDPARPQDGEESFYDSSQNYVPTSIGPHAYRAEWDHVSEDLKHRRRFFSSAASGLFERLFEGVDALASQSNQTGEEEKVAWDIPEGSVCFRARILQSQTLIKEAYKEPLTFLGPPPPHLARGGRMNVDGVAVFYGALDRDTCLAEIRPAIGNDSGVIQLSMTRPLRLLDFRRMEESYKRLSYFQPDFTEQVERGAFLRRLQDLISQPVIPGRETDYLITQTMAEYLAHVHVPKFDGILFKSAQQANGTNIVLFQDGAGAFPLAYVDNSFEVHSTVSVEYRHNKGHVGEHDDGAVWVSLENEHGWE
jgi:hypothetical protein